MKKTVNINLAGTFFHIDEDAYAKLQRYLEAIKRSLSDPQGSDEILRDIEARIAELFSEKIENNSQVISIKELDEVIAVMGQPEDYMVDEEIFEDTPPSAKRKTRSSYKQLFRDIDNKFIAGVSSGLGHYLGLDAIWVRLLWVLLTVFSSGVFVVIYILFWILVPAAESTSDKLKMTGEPVNISNIEKKFKEGYETVADKVKNADYDKYGEKVKSSGTSFFDALGNILLTILKIFVKFFGIILIITALSTLVGLIVGLFTLGSVDIWGQGELLDYFTAVDTSNTPIWLLSLILLFAVGIPFFVLFILGLKLLISNLKSIGTTAKIVLLVLWVASLVGLGIIGVRQATQQAYNGDFIAQNELQVIPGDTLALAMRADDRYSYNVYRGGGIRIEFDENDEKIIYSNDIRLIVRSTTDPTAKLVIERHAKGSSYNDAKERAEAIDYNYSFENGTLLLDGFFTTDFDNKYQDQEMDLILYLPEGSVLIADDNTYSFHRNYASSRDILNNGDEGQYLRILKNKTECLDCPEGENEFETSTEVEGWEQEVIESVDDDDAMPSENISEDIIPDEIEETVVETDSTEFNNDQIN
ncbi:MAG: PspC domain-containing protein [Bacteroidia bacterium]|nr:PspC domain-containing protein [Bacteroidia bacterium]NNF30857.1 PspC domain-containing protein [Flavobacteriaceae bacterium]MBT8275436.1 PspC domain-containing protein [Bacteroidia bacterium]NNJ82534.1 PspC domain-containing protein [Flavobacteriaceae bacterium]NNK54470.1 PspC domain-containing protein [Flavobacteriaceae bacterium]